jgi:hypothetical protein
MLILQAVQPTFLKRDPNKQSRDLSPEAKHFFAQGDSLRITAAAPATNQHIQVTLQQPLNGSVTWFAFAAHVQVVDQSITRLEAARVRQTVFNSFLAIEVQQGFDQNKLAFLDQGIQTSLVEHQIDLYPNRLRQAPNTQLVASTGAVTRPPDTTPAVRSNPYPNLGVIPTIDQTGLSFLHPDIQEACICIGSYTNGQMNARWLGRNALTTAQFWSATKIVPILYVAVQANAKAKDIAIKNCSIRDSQKQQADLNFLEAATDIISYRKDNIEQGIEMSNRLSDTLKRFSSLSGLEQWFVRITGNRALQFRGYYSKAPWIQQPVLQSGATVLLQSQPEGVRGENLVSAYDLTRLLTTLAWHIHLPPAARLPDIQWHSLETVIRSMGYDSARYVDAAIKVLSIADVVSDLVILSKLGFGPSDRRNRTELCYTALVQFVDRRPEAQGKPPRFRTVAMTLRAGVQKLDATGKRDLDEEARWLDARMAAEVTEIMRRLVTEELV